MAGFILGVVVRIRLGLGGFRWFCSWVGFGVIIRWDINMCGRVVLVVEWMILWFWKRKRGKELVIVGKMFYKMLKRKYYL